MCIIVAKVALAIFLYICKYNNEACYKLLQRVFVRGTVLGSKKDYFHGCSETQAPSQICHVLAYVNNVRLCLYLVIFVHKSANKP